MNISNTNLLPTLLGITMCMLPVSAFSADSIPVKMRMAPKAFSLTNDQELTINHSTLPRQYRVCVDSGQDDLAVQVTSDGLIREIISGECWHFQAKKIIIKAAGRLDDDKEVHGTYFRIRL